jgi:hypothetical protein
MCSNLSAWQVTTNFPILSGKLPTCCVGRMAPPQCERVMLTLTILCQFDCVLAPRGGKLNDDELCI